MVLPAIFAGIVRAGIAAGRGIATGANVVVKAGSTVVKESINITKRGFDMFKNIRKGLDSNENQRPTTGQQIAAGAAVIGGAVAAGGAVGKKTIEIGKSLINPEGPGVLITLLVIHFIHSYLFKNNLSTAVLIDIILFFYFWFGFLNGGSSLKNLIIGGFISLAIAALDMGYLFQFLENTALLKSYPRLGLPIFWPWFFYAAVFLNKSKENFVRFAKFGCVAFIMIFVVGTLFMPLINNLLLSSGLKAQKSVEQAEEIEAIKGPEMNSITAWFQCINERAYLRTSMGSCVETKQYPPEKEDDIATITYKKEGMTVDIMENDLFDTISVTPKLEVDFLVNIISPRKAIDVTIGCSIEGRRLESPCSGELNPNKAITNTKITITPEKFTCVPSQDCNTDEAGEYTFKIKATIKEIITQASLESLFVGKLVLENKVAEYIEIKENPRIFGDLNGDGTVDGSDSARSRELLLELEKGWFPLLETKIKEIYPVGVITSMSDPDLSQLALSIGNQMLNTAEKDSLIELTIGLKNTKDDSNINEIKNLTIEIPKGLIPNPDSDEKIEKNCNGFTFKNNILTMTDTYLKSIKSNIGKIEKSGKATKIASCILKINSDTFLEKPDNIESKFFYGKIIYSQNIEQDFKKQVKKEATPAYAPYVNVDIKAVDNYQTEVEKYSTLYGIDKNLINSFILTESNGISTALRCESSYETGSNGPWTTLVSKLGCKPYGCAEWTNSPQGIFHQVSCSYGLMQIMYPTAMQTKAKGETEPFKGEPKDLFDADTNIKYGTAYLAKLLKQFGGDVKKSISAYNAGTGGVGTNPAYVNKIENAYEQLAKTTIPPHIEVTV